MRSSPEGVVRRNLFSPGLVGDLPAELGELVGRVLVCLGDQFGKLAGVERRYGRSR
jgi:hypothetical protein